MASRSLNILLVDDNSDDIDLLREAARRSNVSVQIAMAHDGQETLDYLRDCAEHSPQTQPDLILLDINLPRKNGYEVLRELKSDPRLQLIPVLVFTASVKPTDITLAYELGAAAFLSKPLDFDDLVQILKNVFEFWAVVEPWAGRPPFRRR